MKRYLPFVIVGTVALITIAGGPPGHFSCLLSRELKIYLDSRFLFRGQFLKARIVADLVPDRIEPQQRRSNCTAIGYLQQPLENGNRVIGIPQ